MIKQTVTQAIVLSRTNYQEADRILTVLTPASGKLRLVAKGVRKSKSKMAGGIELFCISEISYIKGKGELGTLTSSRLHQHYGNIVRSAEHTMLGYELIKLLNRVTEDGAEPEYFELQKSALDALNHPEINPDIIKLWFYAQLLQIAGHTPNLHTDRTSQPLATGKTYNFDYENMVFSSTPQGGINPDHIKLLRLVFGGNRPNLLQKVGGADKLLQPCLQLVQTAMNSQLRTT